MENLAKRIILPILTTSLIHFSLKVWENVRFELGSERVNLVDLQLCNGSACASGSRRICLESLGQPFYKRLQGDTTLRLAERATS